jgi:hypothetical protein
MQKYHMTRTTSKNHCFHLRKKKITVFQLRRHVGKNLLDITPRLHKKEDQLIEDQENDCVCLDMYYHHLVNK